MLRSFSLFMMLAALASPAQAETAAPITPVIVMLQSKCDQVFDDALPKLGLRAALVLSSGASAWEKTVINTAIENLHKAMVVCRLYEDVAITSAMGTIGGVASATDLANYDTAVGWLTAYASPPVTSLVGNAFDQYLDSLITSQYSSMLQMIRSSHANLRDVQRLKNYLRDFLAGQVQASIACRTQYRTNQSGSVCAKAIADWGNLWMNGDAQNLGFVRVAATFMAGVANYASAIKVYEDYRLYLESQMPKLAPQYRQALQMQIHDVILQIQSWKGNIKAL